jgi:hypothetical protein
MKQDAIVSKKKIDGMGVQNKENMLNVKPY